MSNIVQFEAVRVLEVSRTAGEYDGWHVNTRPPQVGDIGTVVEILSAEGLPNHLVVECSGPEGFTIWMGEFLESELQVLPNP